jgi:hypothetical protein
MMIRITRATNVDGEMVTLQDFVRELRKAGAIEHAARIELAANAYPHYPFAAGSELAATTRMLEGLSLVHSNWQPNSAASSPSCKNVTWLLAASKGLQGGWKARPLFFAAAWAVVAEQGCPEEGEPMQSVTIGVGLSRELLEPLLRRGATCDDQGRVEMSAGGAARPDGSRQLVPRVIVTDGVYYLDAGGAGRVLVGAT